MYPIKIITKFDKYLQTRNLQFEAVVIGGAALSILGIISRQTQDVDVLDPEIPSEILEAAKLFAKVEGIVQTSLKENWRLRLQPLFKGSAITFTTLGRVDLIGTKILAYCDRGTDFMDCIELNPTPEEILEILPWVKQYDLNPDWPYYVQTQVKELQKRLGHGI